jgi:hypothetical protein
MLLSVNQTTVFWNFNYPRHCSRRASGLVLTAKPLAGVFRPKRVCIGNRRRLLVNLERQNSRCRFKAAIRRGPSAWWVCLESRRVVMSWSKKRY